MADAMLNKEALSFITRIDSHSQHFSGAVLELYERWLPDINIYHDRCDTRL